MWWLFAAYSTPTPVQPTASVMLTVPITHELNSLFSLLSLSQQSILHTAATMILQYTNQITFLHAYNSPVASHSTYKVQTPYHVCEAVLISLIFLSSSHCSPITLPFLSFFRQQASSHLRTLHSISYELANHTPSAHGWLFSLLKSLLKCCFLSGGFPAHIILNGQSIENQFAQTSLPT